MKIGIGVDNGKSYYIDERYGSLEDALHHIQELKRCNYLLNSIKCEDESYVFVNHIISVFESMEEDW